MNGAGALGTPLVSVVVITYQHAPYIERCINSILAQRTTFPFEVMIGEDESTDGTRAICERLAAEHPGKIRLFLRSRADVMYILGRPTGRANVLGLYNDATGKYIAICEGDDLWSDPDKLQLQVDLLEREPQFSGCFTNAYNDLEGQRSEYFGGPGKPRPPAELDLEQVIENATMPTCTLVFRRALIMPLDRAFREAPVGDTVLMVALARKGPLRFIDRYTGIRHVHPGGLHSMRSEVHRLQVSLALVEHIDRLTEGRFAERLERRTVHLLQRLWETALAAGDGAEARKYWKLLLPHRRAAGWSLRTVAGTFVRTWWPRTKAEA